MKTIIKSLPCLIFLLSFQIAIGQSTSNNNIPIVGKFLGYNGAGIDLDFRTNNIDRMRLMESGNTTIDGYTTDYDGHLGLSLTPAFFGTGTGSAIPYSILHLNGTGNNASGPQQFGYRDWMRPGITFTHNSDLMYIGPKVGPGGQDVTDAVIAWADNPGSGEVGPDVLRFLFTGIGMGSTTVSADFQTASDYDGREIARMHGDGRMGVGLNWNNTNQPKRTLDVMNDQDEPQLRLSHDIASTLTGGDHADFQVSDDGDLYIKPQSGDVKAVAIGFLEGELTAPNAPLGNQTILDVGGLTRIRTLPLGGSSDCLVLGSSASGPADNYLKRLDFTGNTDEYLSGNGTWETLNSNDCRWTDVGSTSIPGEMDMYTGVNSGDPNCDRGKVGVGVATLDNAKFEVATDEVNDVINTGIYSIIRTQADENTPGPNYGVLGEAINTGQKPNPIMGVRGNARFAKENIGVFGEAEASPQFLTANNIGLYGIADNTSGTAIENIGVYGEAVGSGPAGYFAGASIQGQPSITISDESLKADIADITDAGVLLNQLEPRTYTYIPIEGRENVLEEGLQYGFIAQEVQAVLPEIVKDASMPAQFDSTGFIEGTNLDLLGIQYEKIIPILVAGFQEQNASLNAQIQANEILQDELAELTQQLQQQEATIESLENQMNDVLSSVQLMQSNVNNCCGTPPVEKAHSEKGNLELEQNFPNPFETETTINFSITEPAQIRLEISDAQGRVLEVLVNGRLSAGSYTERWDASACDPGTYFYSLYNDTELLTKKMIRK